MTAFLVPGQVCSACCCCCVGSNPWMHMNVHADFQFDTDLYDLTVLWSEQDFVSCTVQNKAIYTKRSTLFFASSGTFYITSSGGLDNTVSSNCQDGMRFKIQVYDLDPVLPPTEYNVQPPGLETPAPAPAPVPQNNSLRAASPQLSTEGVDIRFGITWEPQTDPNFYTNFLAESLRKNGFTFLPDTAVLGMFLFKTFSWTSTGRRDANNCNLQVLFPNEFIVVIQYSATSTVLPSETRPTRDHQML